MLKILREVEENVLDLIRNVRMHTMFIDYHDPHVERVWLQIKDGHRLFLHKIYPSKSANDTLFHPHPWPSIIRILKGEYEMGIGHSNTNEIPEVDCKLILGAGSIYTMENPNGWHYVNPIGAPVFSLMVTGEPNHRKMPALPDKKFRELTFSETQDIFNIVREYYD